MSYLEKAKRALDARAAALASARCSRCLELDALGIVVLACSCGYAARPSRPERTAEDREVLRQLLRASRRRAQGRGQLRPVEESADV